MGAQQSKDEDVYQQAAMGNSAGVRSLRRDGAGLEWVDKEGRTPLILACTRGDLFNVVETLIELGANLKAYRPGSNGGTPLHHAAKKGLAQTVLVLLSHGASPLVMNDDCQTPLEMARNKGFVNVVRIIEGHICLFCGWVRELSWPRLFKDLAPQLMTKKVWVVVLPLESRDPSKPIKLELGIYSDLKVSQPQAVVSLWKADIEGPKFDSSDPVLLIIEKQSNSRHKFLSANQGDKEQLRRFYESCRGVSQVNNATEVAAAAAGASVQSTVAAAPTLQENPQRVGTSANGWEDLVGTPGKQNISGSKSKQEPATNAPPPSSKIASSGTHPSSSSGWLPQPGQGSYGGWGPSEAGPSKVSSQPSTSIQGSHLAQTSESAPSAPPIPDEGFLSYPSIDATPVKFDALPSDSVIAQASANTEGDGSSTMCVICWDAPAEGVCIPCGHLAGCMNCLDEIKEKGWGCPVCRAKIDQIVKVYKV